MTSRNMQIVDLADMSDGQEADVFVLLTAKEQLTTRDGKPYFKVGFRDAEREVKHDVIAFCTSITENLEPEQAKFFHFGVTSSDIIDTAYGSTNALWGTTWTAEEINDKDFGVMIRRNDDGNMGLDNIEIRIVWSEVAANAQIF